MALNTLKLLRELNNYTQYFIAVKILGISQNTYSRIEQNPTKLTPPQASKLSILYKVPIETLISKKDLALSFIPRANEETELRIIDNSTRGMEDIEMVKKENELLRKIVMELLDKLAHKKIKMI